MRTRWIASLILAGLGLSCSGTRQSDKANEAAASGLAYATDVVTVGRETVGNALLHISDGGEEWVFSDNAREASALVPGRILVIPGLALRRVTHREQADGRIYLFTEQATLLDTVRDAQLEWTTAVDFHQATPAARERSGPLFDWLRPPVLHAYDIAPIVQTYNTSGEIDGWDYKASAVSGGDKADLSFEVKSKIEGFEISLKGTGHINNFETKGTIFVRDNALKYVNFRNPRLNGEMRYELSWAKEPKVPDPESAEIKLPAVGKIPFPVGPIPLQIELSAAILITPGLSAQGRGTYKFQTKYDGSQGFRFEGNDLLAEAAMQAHGAVAETFSASLAGHAFLVGVSAPRIELKLGFDSVLGMVKKLVPNSIVKGIVEMVEKNPFENFFSRPIRGAARDRLKTDGAASVQILTLATYLSSGPLSLTPCRKMQVIVQGKVGLNASVLGQKLPDKSVDVFRNEHVETWPPGMKCAE